MPISDNKQPDEYSKTQRKKDMKALQNLGETLMNLPATQLAKIPLPEDLLELIHFARTLKSHEAKRRHLQYVGKKMRHVDCEEIILALAKIKFGNAR